MNGEPLPPAIAAAELARLDVGATAAPRDPALYLRYLRALALLCECAPYVDEPDYAELIDAMLDDAAAHYPLDVERDGLRRGIAPRER